MGKWSGNRSGNHERLRKGKRSRLDGERKCCRKDRLLRKGQGEGCGGDPSD